jgi:hypothetical protein
LIKKRDDIQRDIAAETVTDDDIASMTEFSHDAMVGLDNPTPAMKRRWLEYFKSRVEVVCGEVTISCVSALKD